MALEQCPICGIDVDFRGGFKCPVCRGDKRNAVDDEAQPDAGGFDLGDLDALVAPAPADAPVAPAPVAVPPVAAPVRPVAPRSGTDDDEDEDDNQPVVARRLGARSAVVSRPPAPDPAAAPAPAPAPASAPARPAPAPVAPADPPDVAPADPPAAAAPPTGGGNGGKKGKDAAATTTAPAAPPPAPPKSAITVTLAVSKPKESGTGDEQEYWKVDAVADSANAENGGLQIFCNGRLSSCPDATGNHLHTTVYLPGKAGKVFEFTAKHSPSGVEAKPVKIKTDTVKSQVKFAFFHRFCDWLDDALDDDKSQGGK